MKFAKGNIPWNKNKKRPEMSGELHPMYGKHHTEESKQKNRDAVKRGYQNGRKTWNKNKPWSGTTKKKISDSKSGKPNNSPTKFKKGHIPQHKGKVAYWLIGDKNPNWKNGITPLNDIIRRSLEMKLWSDSVKNRDCNCCQKCGENRIGRLTAHHILNFATYVELRFAIDNGILFCKECHRLFHHIYGRKNNTREQVIEFLAD